MATTVKTNLMRHLYRLTSLIILFFFALMVSFAQSPQSVMDTYVGEGPSGTSEGVTCDISDPALQQPPNAQRGIFSDADEVQELAENFVAPKDGNISELCFYGGYFPGNMDNGDDFTVTYYANNGGIPGGVIGGPMPLTVNSKSQTGLILFGVNEVTYSASHTPVAVSGGSTYWVRIVNNTSGNPDIWFWETGDLGTNGTLGFAVRQGASWFLVTNFGDLALTVGYADVIPTVGEWGLIVLGLSFLIVGAVALRYKKPALQKA